MQLQWAQHQQKLSTDDGTADSDPGPAWSSFTTAWAVGDAAAIKSALTAVEADARWQRIDVRLLASIVLGEAVANGRRAAAAELLKAGASPSFAPANVPVLCVAASKGFSCIVKLLLEHRAAVDRIEPRRNWAALHFGCRAGHAGVVDELLRAGCEIGLRGSNGGNTGQELAEGGHSAGEAAARAGRGGAHVLVSMARWGAM